MLIFKKVNSKVLSINNYLQKYLESNQFEKNLKESLNNKNYGVSNSLLYDLSISTYDVNYYKRVLSEIFKAIQEKPYKWRRIYKGLRLCEYVMKNGCEYFISDVKEREEIIKKLTHFTYLEDLKDKGVGIREISNNILKLLRDNKYLKNERIEAAKYANICTNIESKPLEKKGFFSNKKKKKNKIKKIYENNKRNITDSRNSKLFNSKSIFDEIQEERNILNRYTSDNNYSNRNVTNLEKRNIGSDKKSIRSYDSSYSGSSDSHSICESSKNKSRKSKIHSSSSRSSKFSRSSSSSSSNHSSNRSSSRSYYNSTSHSSSHSSRSSSRYSHTRSSHSYSSSTSNTSNSRSNSKSSVRIRRKSNSHRINQLGRRK
ncbi:epsin, putative [Plasmodium relictum]|uniref:Epsin, putative n=1 Tax=Plasmodium relictum TaxID=85471 RepID=A0A1J1HBJ7_PLARL|nr:epsin, putative [Plasmodium relictum]CRH02873.1 epsin, putative [Plasmodium relictum]